MKRLLISVFIILFFCSVDIRFVLGKDATKDNIIKVYCDRKIGQVNNKIFGTNFIGYDPVTYEDWTEEYYGYSDYGAGIWDPKRKKTVKRALNMVRKAGISILRFPGGCGAHHYDWKKAIGKDREHFLYGFDEFLKTCEEIGAEAVITVSYFTGTEQDASDMVEYLNSPDDGSNPNAGIDWAEERAKNGHTLPYNVKYFEIGNEVWHGDHRGIKKVSPEEYAKRYLRYYDAMKVIDPQIKIGPVLHRDDWDKKVLEIVKDKLDFGIIHTYPSPARGNILEQMSSEEIFRVSLGLTILDGESYFQDTLELLRKASSKDIPLAITEYNGGFVHDRPVPYRHCLGTALLNAELLRLFMRPENRILMANYWQFCNSYWGMVKSQEDFMQHDYRRPINYIKRPNYYVFELYHKHFGSELLATDVESDFYTIKGFSVLYLSVNASTNADKNRIYLMVINKNLEQDVIATIDLNSFNPSDKAEAWILNGPGIDATNEKNPKNVKVVYKRFKINANPFQFEFEPRSLTAIEIVRDR